MQKFISNILTGALLLCVSFLQAQTPKTTVSNDSLQKKIAAMMRASDPALTKELYALLKTKEEIKWLLARTFFLQLNKTATSDSITAAAKKKFPKGVVMRGEETQPIYDEKDPVKKEAMYNAWVKKFPPEKFEGERIAYDYVRQAVGRSYAEVGNSAKALYYATLFETRPWSGEGCAGIAMSLMKFGDTASAAGLVKRAIENAEEYKTTRKNEYGAGFAAMGYPSYCEMYAAILTSEKKYAEALEYVMKVKENSKGPRAGLGETYTKLLLALGRNLEAFQCVSEVVAEGQGTPAMKTQMKELYVKLNGSDAGYDMFESNMKRNFTEKLKQSLAKQIVNEPAAGFTVKDAEGKQVSLSDYKGKVVVLDFWATWCTPCKRSFPAMQMAVDKFANDQNVHFLFVDTWENVADYETEVNKFIAENKYRFHVVFDPRQPETKQSVVADAYSVKGIPAKFVIDGKGNVRFKITGFSGGNEAAVEELSEMIEMARKS